MCERTGKVTAATVIDHKISMANGGDFWDEDNWQGLCTKCHRIKTNKEISIRNQK
jgi:5-methylcytosine-specific restriction protein A